jgi:ketosteroid isomerase-like protein
MKKAKWALVVLAAVAVAAFLLLRKPPTDKQLIEQLILRLEEAIEKKQFARIMACIGEDYEDETGLTRRDLMRLAFRYVRDRGWADVLLSDVQIEVQDRAAVANMYAEVSYTEESMESNPFSGEVTVFFRKRGSRWFIVKSEGWQTTVGTPLE